MKLKLLPLLFSLCFAIIPASLQADVQAQKVFTETDAAAPISVNKGETITFSLKSTTPGAWNYTALAANFSDATIPANDSTASLLSVDNNASFTNLTGTSIGEVFIANNSGQIVLLFTQVGGDAVLKYQKAVTFIINIKDPAADK